MAFLVHPPVCLFLLIVLSSWPMGAAAAVVFPISEGLVWKDSKTLQAPADIKRDEQLLFLSRLADWASRMNEAPLSRKVKVEFNPRQAKATFSQPPARDKAPCKNFFWKTFSSC
ncbi:cortistatin [Tiliqua scincoides]|uniref:cortistatin n=1 Tax=Tiliqua scincoides TaxID=71010 RepID=UPI0034619501